MWRGQGRRLTTNKRCFSHLRCEGLHGRWVGFGRIRRVVGRSRNRRKRRSLVRRRDNWRVLRRPAICLRRHGYILLHRRRRRPAVGCGRRVSHRHVGRRRHATVLVLLRYGIVRRCSVGCHVGVRVHRLAHLVHMCGVLVVVVCVVMRLCSTTSSSRPSPSSSTTNTRPGANLRSTVHALPSRQMPSIVHHAGLGAVEVRWLITCVMPPRFRTATGNS